MSTLTHCLRGWHVAAEMPEELALERFLSQRRVERLRRDTEQRCMSVTVVLDGVHDPHNIGAVVRSAEAFGLLEMHVVESCAPCRLSRRVTQGADKWLSVKTWPEPELCARDLLERGFVLWRAEPDAPDSLYDIEWRGKVALVFGNEHMGLSDEMKLAASRAFRIPLYGFSQSLNVSVAAGISLAWLVQWRERNLGGHGDLDEQMRRALLERWQKLSVAQAERILRHLENRKAK
ncbi:MAG: TrmH family RNA methyltransferase [Deltaproteobacteria bacterium]|nr:MAG: TrmH family RNA methyltransferase [Deltaproteobacteria bacterium]